MTRGDVAFARHRVDAAIENVVWLMDSGASLAEACRRSDVGVSVMEKALQRRRDRIIARVAADFESSGETPEGARDQCIYESHRFVLALREAGVRDAETIDGFARGRFQGHDVIVAGHTAVKIGSDTVYDWTARQFDPDAAWPLIEPYKVWRGRWRAL